MSETENTSYASDSTVSHQLEEFALLEEQDCVVVVLLDLPELRLKWREILPGTRWNV
jgi:hypothetical protein